MNAAAPAPELSLLDFIVERETIRLRRAAGEPWPWTNDPILRADRFCNIRREHDRVTIWIRESWREPHADDHDVWFAMAVARFVNLPDTLAELGYPVPWDPDRFIAVMADRKRRDKKREGDAYRIRANPKAAGAPKALYVANDVLSPLWADRKRLRPRRDDSLEGWASDLSEHHGFGEGFMTGQVVADVKQIAPLRSAPDWFTWVVSGPGSRRGLNRVLGRPVDAPWSEANWRRELRRLHADLAPELERLGIGRLCAQDFQNTLCEYEKWARGGSGRKFEPPAGTRLPGTLF